MNPKSAPHAVRMHPKLPSPRSRASSTITRDWELQDINDVPQLMKSYSFKNYLQAVDFTNRIAELAEKEGHHPAIVLEWGKVQVSWWTHKIRGLHENDFIMSAKTDQLFDSM